MRMLPIKNIRMDFSFYGLPSFIYSLKTLPIERGNSMGRTDQLIRMG